MCPLNDYVCEVCHAEYEIHVPIARLDEDIKCPACDEAQVQSILRRELSYPRVIKVN